MRRRRRPGIWSLYSEIPGSLALRASRNDEALPLVLALIDQCALLDPRHHVAELGADFLDRVCRELGAGGLERGLVDFVLQHPVAGELAALDVGEHLAHLLLGLIGNDARASGHW